MEPEQIEQAIKSKERILIADGDPLGRETLNVLLMSQGYDLSFVTTGPETLKTVEEMVPDLLLLNAMMPEIDGFAVCQQLRANSKVAEIPIIMVTSLDDNAARLRGLEVGVDDFITTPFDMAQLRARVRTITHLNRQRRLRAVELQAERDRTQAILEAVGEAVVVTDVDGLIQYLNPAAVALTGYQREELRGHPWQLIQDEATGAKLDEILAVVRTGKTWQGEGVSRHKNNQSCDVALTVAPLFESERPDQLLGFVSVQRDITPLKEAQRLKDQFVSNVSHELRTPLSVITLVGDNLDTFYDRLDDQKRRKMIQDIQKHSQTLDELIEDVLVLSRIDSHQISTEHHRLDLARLAVEEVEKLLPLARQQGHTLEIAAAQAVWASGNDKELRQVVRNLVNNAIKYTPAGGEIFCQCLALSSAAAGLDAEWPGHQELAAGSWAAFQVKDNGPGIGAEHLPHLFERFYRVQAEQKIRGTGLGLAITQEFIEHNNGTIFVASTPDQGSTFAFYLPLEER